MGRFFLGGGRGRGQVGLNEELKFFRDITFAKLQSTKFKKGQ